MASTEDAFPLALARDAAGWALLLLDQADNPAAADVLLEQLLAAPPADAAQMLLMLVNLTGRAGVSCPDVASLKVTLRDISRGRFDDDLYYAGG